MAAVFHNGEKVAPIAGNNTVGIEALHGAQLMSRQASASGDRERQWKRRPRCLARHTKGCGCSREASQVGMASHPASRVRYRCTASPREQKGNKMRQGTCGAAQMPPAATGGRAGHYLVPDGRAAAWGREAACVVPGYRRPRLAPLLGTPEGEGAEGTSTSGASSSTSGSSARHSSASSSYPRSESGAMSPCSSSSTSRGGSGAVRPGGGCVW